jgi:hypothetical protein
MMGMGMPSNHNMSRGSRASTADYLIGAGIGAPVTAESRDDMSARTTELFAGRGHTIQLPPRYRGKGNRHARLWRSRRKDAAALRAAAAPYGRLSRRPQHLAPVQRYGNLVPWIWPACGGPRLPLKYCIENIKIRKAVAHGSRPQFVGACPVA